MYSKICLLCNYSDLALRAEGMNSVFKDVEKTVVNSWWFSEVPSLIKSEQKLHEETRKHLEGIISDKLQLLFLIHVYYNFFEAQIATVFRDLLVVYVFGWYFRLCFEKRNSTEGVN